MWDDTAYRDLYVSCKLYGSNGDCADVIATPEVSGEIPEVNEANGGSDPAADVIAREYCDLEFV